MDPEGSLTIQSSKSLPWVQAAVLRITNVVSKHISILSLSLALSIPILSNLNILA